MSTEFCAVPCAAKAFSLNHLPSKQAYQMSQGFIASEKPELQRVRRPDD